MCVHLPIQTYTSSVSSTINGNYQLPDSMTGSQPALKKYFISVCVFVAILFLSPLAAKQQSFCQTLGKSSHLTPSSTTQAGRGNVYKTPRLSPPVALTLTRSPVYTSSILWLFSSLFRDLLCLKWLEGEKRQIVPVLMLGAGEDCPAAVPDRVRGRREGGGGSF